MKEYLYILLICIAAFLLPQHLNNFQEGGFFAFNSTWSLIVIFFLLFLGVNVIIIVVCVIEFAIIVLNLLAGIGYVTDYDWFYTNYEVMLNTLNISEAVVIFMWKPLDGISTKFKRFFEQLWLANIANWICSNSWIPYSHKNKAKL